MGVATGASTFFRQIGGTLGVAVLLSVLFAALPGNIITANENKATITEGLNAALTPSIADAPKNKGVMKELWNKEVDPIKAGVAKELAPANAQLAKIPAGPARDAALTSAAAKGNVSVIDGTLQIDWANASQREAVVTKTVPTILKELKSAKTSSSSSSESDTSFLNGATPALTKAFKVAFNSSVISIYWIGFGVILLAFVITLFFRVPPLRKTSALQQRADEGGVTATGRIKTQA
jgi:hypothetical protein